MRLNLLLGEKMKYKLILMPIIQRLIAAIVGALLALVSAQLPPEMTTGDAFIQLSQHMTTVLTAVALLGLDLILGRV